MTRDFFFVFLHMNMLNAETIQVIKSKVRIVDVISDYISLKRRGDTFIAHCPFHNEKEPTFTVQPEKNIFYCFGCQRGGDAVEFLMHIEHCSQEDALLRLAQRYEIAVEGDPQGDELYRVSEFAQRWFVDVLNNDEMGRAIGLSYYHSRGLTEEIIRNFGLGYCPESRTAFTDSARKAGFSEEVLVQSGLTVRRDDGQLYDRFKGRVTFPIYNVAGRVLAFSCRTLRNDKEVAKYVNSPETPIYVKGNVLYGLYQAKDAIREQNKCYLVEGNVDVVSMHQSGVTNTIASCGTAFTASQARLIKQHTDNVTIVYDGDGAGIKATKKAAEILFMEGMKIKMVLFPDNNDPDSYAAKYGAEKLREYLSQNEKDYIQYCFLVMEDNVIKDPIRKAQAEKDMVKALALVQDRNERDHYITMLASRFHSQERSLRAEIAKVMADIAKKEFEAQAPAPAAPLAPPDDLFLPDEYKDPVPAPQPSQPMPLHLPDEAQESKIISLLLNHGRNIIKVPTKNENGEDEITEEYVAVVIVSDILASECSFDNPIYKVIFDEFLSAINNGELPPPDYFINYPEPELRNKALSLMVNTMHVSDKWAEKHIAVQKPDDNISEDVQYALLTFKMHKLDHKIEEIDRKIRTCKDPEELLMHVAEKNLLVKSRKEIANEINCVYN